MPLTFAASGYMEYGVALMTCGVAEADSNLFISGASGGFPL